jgi:hypothetical protein
MNGGCDAASDAIQHSFYIVGSFEGDRAVRRGKIEQDM